MNDRQTGQTTKQVLDLLARVEEGEKHFFVCGSERECRYTISLIAKHLPGSRFRCSSSVFELINGHSGWLRLVSIDGDPHRIVPGTTGQITFDHAARLGQITARELQWIEFQNLQKRYLQPESGQ